MECTPVIHSRLVYVLSKSPRGEQPVEDIPKFICICVYFIYLRIYLCICVTPPAQTINDTDLKFGTHTPIDLF